MFPVYVEDETLIFEKNYYSFKEVLEHVGVDYTNDGTWMVNLYQVFQMDAPEASKFYKALGIFLSDPHISICNSLDDAESKLLMLINKNDMIVEDYLAYETAITQEVNALESKSTVRFNDTPDEEGEYSAQKYTSNITETSNSVDYDINTKINVARKRLRHLREAYCNEFKGMIIWTD